MCASVIDVSLWEPISPESPAGIDLSATTEWVNIRNARPSAWEARSREYERLNSTEASWPLLSELTADALKTKTKDLRIAVLHTESSARLHGFKGVRDGLRLIGQLLTQYWECGLYPLIEDGDPELRSGPLTWLNEKFPEVIREIPLTFRAPPAENYSKSFYDEAHRANGVITTREFEVAVAVGSREQYEALRTEIAEAFEGLSDLDKAAREKLGEDGLSLVALREALSDCRDVVERILRQKPKLSATVAAAEAAVPAATTAAAWTGVSVGPADSSSGADWTKAEAMAREGQTSVALANMTDLAAREPNGRVRFQRKLMLADICLQTKRDRLAKSILEELAELIDKHQLEHWETSELIGAVWTRLYKCYCNTKVGTEDAEKAAQLYRRLTRLNPWQALVCSEVG